MFLDFLFIIRQTSVEAPSGDQVLGINMSSQKGEHRHFDSYTPEPRLHLTPASHTSCPVAHLLWHSVGLGAIPGAVFTPVLASQQHTAKSRIERVPDDQENQGKRKMQKQEIDGNFLRRSWGGVMATPEQAQQRGGVEVTLMHGVTLLVMPALIYASGINEVGPLQTCQPDL